MIVSVKSIGNIMAVTVLLIFMFGVIGKHLSYKKWNSRQKMPFQTRSGINPAVLKPEKHRVKNRMIRMTWNWMNSIPERAATTFAFSSNCFFFYAKEICPWISHDTCCCSATWHRCAAVQGQVFHLLRPQHEHKSHLPGERKQQPGANSGFRLRLRFPVTGSGSYFCTNYNCFKSRLYNNKKDNLLYETLHIFLT